MREYPKLSGRSCIFPKLFTNFSFAYRYFYLHLPGKDTLSQRRAADFCFELGHAGMLTPAFRAGALHATSFSSESEPPTRAKRSGFASRNKLANPRTNPSSG